jgi:hypothetical protein
MVSSPEAVASRSAAEPMLASQAGSHSIAPISGHHIPVFIAPPGLSSRSLDAD